MISKKAKDILSREAELRSSINSIYKHFKGDIYILLDIAQHTETEDLMVVYRALYGEHKLFVRPIDMFLSECTLEQQDRYGVKYRFTKIEIHPRSPRD